MGLNCRFDRLYIKTFLLLQNDQLPELLRKHWGKACDHRWKVERYWRHEWWSRVSSSSEQHAERCLHPQLSRPAAEGSRKYFDAGKFKNNFHCATVLNHICFQGNVNMINQPMTSHPQTVVLGNQIVKVQSMNQMQQKLNSQPGASGATASQDGQRPLILGSTIKVLKVS